MKNLRFVHMGNPHLAVQESTIEAVNWSGDIEVLSALDGSVKNAGVKRYQQLNNQHLSPVDARAIPPDGMLLKVRTTQSEIGIAIAARTRLFLDGQRIELSPDTTASGGIVAQRFRTQLQQGQSLRTEKAITLHTSRDNAVAECADAAERDLQRLPESTQLRRQHELAWKHLWRMFDIDVELASSVSHLDWVSSTLHLHVFHLLQTVSRHTMDMDVGVPSRGWHGEAYRGHIFWDELFIFPLLNMRMPSSTRALLLYRYRRLNEARAMAKEEGYRGAMYPWQSGSTGREESQMLHLNPKSGRWNPDNSRLQRHVGLAIAYNVWQYFQVTEDLEFLCSQGAEMIFEIARFWASKAHYNEEHDRYEIHGVMGPDEYHDGYPDADEPGLHNNAYTNVMAVWLFCRALELPKVLPTGRLLELRELLQLDEEELRHWEEISHKMRIPFHGDGIISQFEGYDELLEFPWDEYREKYGDIQRLDRILEAENDTPNRYKASKQADVLMLTYLFSAEELEAIFRRLGYPFPKDTIPKNIDYYMERTSHGSTLSRVVHSWVLARSDRVASWELFEQALASDVSDIQGGTTAEGIHLGAMAGTVDLVQRCYTGMRPRQNALQFNPCLPSQIERLRMRVDYRGQRVDVELTQKALSVSLLPGQGEAIQVGFDGNVHELEAGETLRLAIRPKPSDKDC